MTKRCYLCKHETFEKQKEAGKKMCELYGFTGRQEQNLTPYLLQFFSHGVNNPHGWGIADINRPGDIHVETEAVRSDKSQLLPHIIKNQRPSKLLLAHIRYGTVGEARAANCHPFVFPDYSATRWVFMHNGTIFHSSVLGKYQRQQRGTTDSERILLYLIDSLNNAYAVKKNISEEEIRKNMIEKIIFELSLGNKLNLILSDGKKLYVHTNMKNTLFCKQEFGGIHFATVPLDDEKWSPVELNRLLIYDSGKLIYRSDAHSNEYFSDKEPQGYTADSGTGKAAASEDWLDHALWHKYILPTKRQPTNCVGVEFEFPVINKNHSPVDFKVVHELSESFVEKFGFERTNRDDDGFIYSAFSPQNGDDLSFDCSYNTLELSFGKEENMNGIYARFVKYYEYIQAYLIKHNHMISGMGINPERMNNKNVPIPNERYRMLLHHLMSYKKYDGDFHDYPNFGLFSCASQVQLDVGKENIAQTLNVFNKLEPLKSVLFANSYLPETDQLCSRDDLWGKSLHGINPHNVGEYGVQFRSNCDVLRYIKSMSIYSMERAGKYINFEPLPLSEYFSREFVTGEYFDGELYRLITFTPEPEDLQFLRSFKFEDLTFRGTVEFRSVCQQPVRDIMSVAAFHAGLAKKLDALDTLLSENDLISGCGFTVSELRRIFNSAVWPAFIDRAALSDLLMEVLDIAKAGLIARGMEEEHFLAPLYDRARTTLSPAARIREGIENGKKIDDFIEEYAVLA